MPKIPLFQQQSRVSDQAPGVQYDPSAEIQALGQVADSIAGGIENLGAGVQKGIERYEMLKDEAAESEANQLMLDFQNQMLLDKEKVLREDPDIGFMNYEEKYLQPKINAFRNVLQNRGYSDRVIGRIMERADMDFGNMIQAERIDRVQKSTANYIATIQEEASLKMLSGDKKKYDEGVDQLDQMVEAGYITTVTKDNFISDTNKAYFESKAKSATTLDEINALTEDPRYNSMSESDQGMVLQIANEAATKYYNETIATNIAEAEKMLNAGLLDFDQLEALDIPDAQKAGMRQVIEQQIRELRTGYVDVEDAVNLDVLDSRIQKLWSGTFKGDSVEEFNDIFNVITTSNMPEQLKAAYQEEILDAMRTPQGFNVFVKGNKESLYDSDDAWVWENYWNMYDDATTFMPRDLKKGDMVLKRQAIMNFIKEGRKAVIGKEPEVTIERGTGRMKQITARDEFRATAARAEQAGSARLQFDNDGNLVDNIHNRNVVYDFINEQFGEYLEYKTKVMFQKAFGVNTPLARPTIFEEYYIPPKLSTGDPGVRRATDAQRELERQGQLPAEG
jgi:hypothetical protein